LGAIEWGGDVHVPPGDLARAREICHITRDAGLSVVAYGSYLRLGENDQPDFCAVVETTRELGAPAVRVWAGKRGSAGADEAYRRRVAGRCAAACGRREGRGRRRLLRVSR
jgi:hypothetical protein